MMALGDDVAASPATSHAALRSRWSPQRGRGRRLRIGLRRDRLRRTDRALCRPSDDPRPSGPGAAPAAADRRLLLLLADLAVRFGPAGRTIPVGVLTTVVGTPLFIWIVVTDAPEGDVMTSCSRSARGRSGRATQVRLTSDRVRPSWSLSSAQRRRQDEPAARFAGIEQCGELGSRAKICRFTPSRGPLSYLAPASRDLVWPIAVARRDRAWAAPRQSGSTKLIEQLELGTLAGRRWIVCRPANARGCSCAGARPDHGCCCSTSRYRTSTPIGCFGCWRYFGSVEDGYVSDGCAARHRAHRLLRPRTPDG